MGNCQAAEAATVIIHHPSGKVERAYWSMSATDVMAANPGHYVAVVIDANAPRPRHRPPPSHANVAFASSSCSSRGSAHAGGAASTVKHLKLLRPDDTLHIGHVYRLVSFEEVLREFASKRHVRLSRLLLKEEKKASRSRRGGGGGSGGEGRRRHSRQSDGIRTAEPNTSSATEQIGVEEEEETRVDAELEAVVRGMMTMGSTARSRASGTGGGGGAPRRQGQWRPALQSIAEVGS
ncbi:hypothetical protein Cni_G20409 [Canna indica]|uniref:Uncharacterized protein n=1 Tax=Canna indica TaxID=4628 RepID=A0AAQ3KP22_9LILI|nr:hypothetical protein Cni_G20409 [Canna indica]